MLITRVQIGFYTNNMDVTNVNADIQQSLQQQLTICNLGTISKLREHSIKIMKALINQEIALLDLFCM